LRRITELRRLIEEALTFYGRTVQLARTGRREAAIALVRSGEGKALMDRARSITDAIIQKDEEVLRRQRAQAERASRASSWMTYGVAVAGAGLLLLSIVATAIAARRTQQAQSAAALAQHAGALELALETQEALLYEVNHRVKNSLQVVMSLLYLQENQVRDPVGRQALVDARARVNVIASIHQSLYKHGTHTEVELCSYLGELASSIVSSLDAAQRLKVDVQCSSEVTLPIQQAVPLALIVAELLTNSIKYAFADGIAGRILVQAEAQGSSLRLLVSDNGCGLPPEFNPTHSTGVGMRVIRALTKQLRATMEVLQQERGAAFAFSLPLKSS
jgi:two-component sensor histidine kinase